MDYPVKSFTDCPNDDTLLLSIINLLNGNEIKGGNNMAKMPDGVCNICGNYGKLSFEHVPPKGAFNDRPVIKGNFEDFTNNPPGEELKKGRIQQKGAGAYTLCEKCNNDTGAYYGNSFIDWTYQALILSSKTDGNGAVLYPFHIFPLRIIKQVITMFFSTNGDSFHKAHPDLVRFVLNPEEKYIKPSIRLFTYLTSGSRSRQTGVVGAGNLNSSGITIMSEIAFPPVGYLMTIDSAPPDERLTEITQFARYGFNEFETVFLSMKKLPIEYYLPGDYRSMDEMMKDYEANMTEYGGHPDE